MSKVSDLFSALAGVRIKRANLKEMINFALESASICVKRLSVKRCSTVYVWDIFCQLVCTRVEIFAIFALKGGRVLRASWSGERFEKSLASWCKRGLGFQL